MVAEIESEIIIEDSGSFKTLYNLPPDINVVVCIGGRPRGEKNIRGK